jgi:S1-C subfamily serine protease
LRVIHGKLAFLASVKSPRDHVYRKLVDKFNKLPKPDINLSLPYIEETNSERKAMEALWVFESCYDDLSVQNEDERLRVAQGTGFQFSNLGIITCAHVVSHNNEVLEEIEVFKSDRTNTRYQVIVQYIDYHRDIAICQLKNPEPMAPAITIDEEFNEIQQREEVILLGFPAYNIGQSPTVVDAKISSIYPQNGIPKFEISSQIREGNSGGPIINKLGKVVGVALEGAQKDGGNNGCILISEIHELIISK